METKTEPSAERLPSPRERFVMKCDAANPFVALRTHAYIVDCREGWVCYKGKEDAPNEPWALTTRTLEDFFTLYQREEYGK